LTPIWCSRVEHALAREWDGDGVIVPAVRPRGRKVLWVHTAAPSDPFPDGWTKIRRDSVIPGKSGVITENGEKREVAWKD